MKTKLALLLIITAAYSAAFGSDTTERPFKRVYIGLSVTPDISYRYLHGNFVPAGISQADLQGAVDYSNKHSIPEFGINAAFKVGINLTQWLAVESGVGYSLIRYQYNPNQYYSPNVFTGNVVAPSDSFLTKDRETYEYFTIPIGLRFSIGHKKVRGIIAAGVDLDFLIKQDASYLYTYPNGQVVSGERVVAPDNFKTFNVSPYFGAGIDCYLGRTFILRVMPQAEIQGLKNINTPVTEYLWNAGLNVSFLFGL